MSTDVSVERLQHALVFTAWVVETFGAQYLPIFERIEKELELASTKESARARVARIVAEHKQRAAP
jgi:hypothetical protein